MMRFFKILTGILIFAFIHDAVSAQTLSSNEIAVPPMIMIFVAEGKPSVKEGEHVVLKVKGNDEFSALQWQSSLDGINWRDIPKATGINYETPPITQMHYFRVLCRAIDATVNDVVTLSNVQIIALQDNVASRKRD